MATGADARPGMSSSLQPVDYVVTGVLLLVPLAIGLWFAVKDAKRATRDEYLLGGRRMAMLPVTLSLFVTYQSSISLMGVPSDVYTFGVMFTVMYIGFNLSYVFGYFTMVPLFFPLRLTSLYEYLERRYRCQTLRLVATLIGMMQTMFYMAIVQLAPALALQAAAGTPLWLSLAIVGIVGTVYTALGGIKSVIWTDAFQCVVMLAGVVSVIVKGSTVVGGFDKVIDIAQAEGRLNFNRSTFDPRERNTWLGNILGGTFLWLANLWNQSTLQRISSLRSEKAAKRMFALNTVLFTVYGVMLACMGCVVFAYFSQSRCDPFESGLITNRNQVAPFFVVQTMADSPGMAGFFMATLFSGSLSTLSSGINALAANTVEDLLKKQLRGVSESWATCFTKILVLFYGAIIVGMAYGANSVKGPVTQMGLTVFGACGGPVLGVFLAGAAVPWVHKRGALVGLLVALATTMWIAVGNQMHGRAVSRLPAPPTDRCYVNQTSGSALTNMADGFDDVFKIRFTDNGFNVTFLYGDEGDSDVVTSSILPERNITDGGVQDPHAFGFFIYDISYEWYAVIGTFISFVCSVVFSCSRTRNVHAFRVDSKLVLPFARRYWQLSEPKYSDDEPGDDVGKETALKPFDDDYEWKAGMNDDRDKRAVTDSDKMNNDGLLLIQDPS